MPPIATEIASVTEAEPPSSAAEMVEERTQSPLFFSVAGTPETMGPQTADTLVALNAAVKAQKSAAKAGPSGPKWGGMLCRETWSNSDGSSCFINAALSFLSLLPWPPTLRVECPDLLREVRVAILAMRDAGTLPAHRTRVRTALVAAFPEEGFHVGQHDAGEVVPLVLRQAEKQCDLRSHFL